jgi:hypothetical protein
MQLNELQQQLETLPNEIRDQELKVIEKEHTTQLDKLTYDVAFSQAMLRSQKPNATEKKAEALIETRVLKESLFNSEMKLKKEESAQRHLENRFTSVRKLASMEMENMKSQITGT